MEQNDEKYLQQQMTFAVQKSDEINNMLGQATDMFHHYENKARELKVKLGLESGNMQSKEIITTKEEILSFIKRIIETSIHDKTLQKMLLKSLDEVVLTGDFVVAEPGEEFSVAGGVSLTPYKKGEDVRKTFSVVMGENKGGKIKTELGQIMVVFHELFHSISSKFDTKRITKNYDKYGESRNIKAQEIGEVESIFAEKLFLDIIEERAKTGELPFDYSSEDELMADIYLLKSRQVAEFCNHSKDVVDTQNIGRTGNSKEYHFRYVVGYADASVLFDEYLKGKTKQNNKALKSLVKFLQKQYTLSMDEAVKIITDKKFKSYGQIIEEVNNIHHKNIEDLIHGENAEHTITEEILGEEDLDSKPVISKVAPDAVKQEKGVTDESVRHYVVKNGPINQDQMVHGEDEREKQ